jgi:hypothetical protein
VEKGSNQNTIFVQKLGHHSTDSFLKNMKASIVLANYVGKFGLPLSHLKITLDTFSIQNIFPSLLSPPLNLKL